MENRERDSHGRYVSPAREVAEKAKWLAFQMAELEAAAVKLLAAENQPPAWLRNLVLTVAVELGITAGDIQARMAIIHPSAIDPVLLVDGKPVAMWFNF